MCHKTSAFDGHCDGIHILQSCGLICHLHSVQFSVQQGQAEQACLELVLTFKLNSSRHVLHARMFTACGSGTLLDLLLHASCFSL